MSLKISDLQALNSVTIGQTGFTPKLLVEGSNSSGLAEIYVSAGSGNALRLNTNFVNGNYIDINPYITGISNGGFSISQNGTPRFVIMAGGNIGINTTTDAGYRLDIGGGVRSATDSVIAGSFSFINLENNSSKLNVSRYLALQDNASAVGIGYNSDTNPIGGKLSVNGNSYFSGRIFFDGGYMNTGDCFEKVFQSSINFPNGVSNLAANIELGNLSFWGYIEVEVNSTYNNQNSTGKLTKVFAVGTNPGNLIYTNESRIVDSMGTIPDNIAIGDFMWSSSISKYIIPISHIASSGNVFTVKVRMFTAGGGARPVFEAMSIGSNYTLTALARQYPQYNSRLGVNLVNPTQALDVYGNVQVNNTNGFVWAYGDGQFYNSITSSYDPADGIRYRSGGWTGNQAAICHSFQTHNGGWQNRLNIVQNGNVLIGTTTDAGYKLDVNGMGRFQTNLRSPLIGANASPENGYPLTVGCSSGANGIKIIGRSDNVGYIEFFNSNGSTVNSSINGSTSGLQITGTTTFSNTVTAAGFFNSSDIRLKEIVPYEYSVSDIKPISYLWKDLRDNKKHIGYSAQDVQKVMPDAVNEGEDGMLSVNYVEVLVAKIAELENRIKQLEK